VLVLGDVETVGVVCEGEAGLGVAVMVFGYGRRGWC